MSEPRRPGGYPGRTLRTLFLRVPASDWPAVRQGNKTEFRVIARSGKTIVPHCPTVVVAYAVNRQGQKASKLMVLESQERQQLIQISEDPEALAREGFATYQEFIAYFRRRQSHAYRMTQDVIVSRVRPINPVPHDAEDLTGLAWGLLERLYGEWMAHPPFNFSEHFA